MKLSDFAPENKQMLCFVGKGGHGKSIGASYWPKPMYYASCDGRIKAVWDWWNRRKPEVLKDIEFDSYTAGDYDKLATKMEGFQTKNPFKNGTIILDPLTMIGDMLIQYSFSMGTTGGGAPRGRIKISGPDEYRTESAGLKKLIDGGRVLNSHFILCAHILEDTYYALGEDKPRITRKLLTAGKAPAAALPGMFDELWLFTIASDGVIGKPPKYKIVTRPSEEFDTLRTSCNMPVTLDWTDKDLYQIASPYLNAPRKGVTQLVEGADTLPEVEAQIVAEGKK